ncbi:sorting nexin-19-like isoform X1 [Sinocyclocheilus anshuiensis]|uniref:sorting nexin-19-like isoform X1 n=1 Tax=Sinocyclocheilus anshuiensis TaxID=1608454 RepID=UPI0007BA9D3E|nr:PREDICTED: sorting nexin-19-like isoform X1 [Sinocyclocheilus anshuiensis]
MSPPEHLNVSPWGLSEFLVQRRLLGFGALLAWIILFHLLVNVWLLCVFTSLLVVLGGWFGSQAVLDSDSVVHLERFARLDKIPHSAESEQQLEDEIQKTVAKIIRDFVTSWYSTISREKEFEDEVHNAMISIAMELKGRAARVDRKALSQRVLDLSGCHLQCYLSAKEAIKHQVVDKDGDLWEVYSKLCPPHPALQSSAVEVNYVRAIVDLLLHVLVPPPHLETRTGRFVVGELITCNVLLPLIAKLSDPDWLNMLIVSIFSKSSEPAPEPEPVEVQAPPQVVSDQENTLQELEIPCVLTLKATPETPTAMEAPTPELAVYDVIDSGDLYSPHNLEEDEPRSTKPFPLGFSPRDYLRLGKSNPFYQETDSDLDSPLTDFKRDSLESLVLIGSEETLSERLAECTTPVDAVLDLEDELPTYTNTTEKELSVHSTCVPEEESSSFCTLQPLEKSNSSADQPGLVNPSELALTAPIQASSPAGMASLATFSFEPLSSPEGPVIIQNLRITGTITAKEHRGTGSHPYTLYTVKYETAMDSENPEALQPMAYHTVNRRYSEFLNLQTRLEEKPELRKILKNVKGPKKIFPELPFGNMDSDKVEARKGLLETFLRQLCAIPETANSEEMQEFLALNTDARIAFVKKPFIVSRIDRIVVNAIVDTLKTAFPRSEPQSPTDEIDADPDGKLSTDKKSKSRMRFSTKVAPALSVSDMKPKVLYCFDESSSVFNGFSLNELESFISEKERLEGKAGFDADAERSGGPGPKWDMKTCTCARAQLQNAPDFSDSASETPLSDQVLNILCVLMKDQWSWLCTENIQRTIRMLFGTLIERWLEVGVVNLTCTQYWVIYLRVLQEAIWPGGSLPAQPRPHRSQQQKQESREQALQCLMKLLPDLISDMLGSEKYKISWQMVVDSFQDPTINRHLVYCIWDLLIEFLVPEASDGDFQKTLLHSLSKNAEKLPP